MKMNPNIHITILNKLHKLYTLATSNFLLDWNFLKAVRTEHEHDRRGDRVHQQRKREEERKQDLENFQKLLDKSLNFNLKF